MGKKYIIELPENTHWIQWLMEGTEDHHPYMDFKSVEDLTSYTEPDLEHVRKEAYEQGYYIGYSVYLNRSYEDGLKDAWEAARKIVTMPDRDFINSDILDLDPGESIFTKYTASEAIEKIRQYEQEQEEIKVGDEVKIEDGQKMVIAAIVNKDFVGLAVDGRFMFGPLDETITRTGRHFPEIAAVLQKMRGEKE